MEKLQPIVDNFLKSIDSQGRKDESDAEFTLDPTKQAERFSTFQHENSLYCLLRVFQGLTLAKTESVDLKINRKYIRMVARHPTLEMQPEKLYEALYKANRDPYLEHICAGLFSATHESVARLEISLGYRTLRVENKEFTLVESGDKVQHLQVTLTFPSRGWQLTGAKEHVELLKRLHMAPMIVTIDGRPLSPLEPTPKRDRWYKKISRAQLLAKVVRGLPEEAKLTPLSEELYLCENPCGTRSFVLQDYEGTLYLDLAFDEEESIAPVIDGVIGTPVQTSRFPGFHGYQSADGLKTDLSGLTVRDDRRLLDRIAGRYLKTLEAVAPHLSHLKAVWPKNLNMTSVAVVGAYSMELALVVMPVVLLAGGIYQACDRFRFGLKKQSSQEALVEQTASKLKILIENSQHDLKGT